MALADLSAAHPGHRARFREPVPARAERHVHRDAGDLPPVADQRLSEVTDAERNLTAVVREAALTPTTARTGSY